VVACCTRRIINAPSGLNGSPQPLVRRQVKPAWRWARMVELKRGSAKSRFDYQRLFFALTITFAFGKLAQL
jgi:hypothetical protein